MNRLKFNEGGQPVYLDDLKLLQDNDEGAMSSLMEALGGGKTAFLLKKIDVTDASADIEAGTTSFTFKSGILVVGGEFLVWPETRLSVKTWNDPVYLCIRETDTDSRTFEDGQTRTCVKSREVYLSLDYAGVQEYYNIFDLPTFADVVKDFLGYKENVWKSVNVNFQNGYSGSVKYQDLTEFYRVWINIKSSNMDSISGSVWLFYSDASFLQYFQSSTKAYVQTENGILSFSLYGFEGNVRADVNLPYDDAENAGSLPVRIIFEIPK